MRKRTTKTPEKKGKQTNQAKQDDKEKAGRPEKLDQEQLNDVSGGAVRGIYLPPPR